MKAEGRIFAILCVFFLLTTVVYGWLSHEVVGTTALLLSTLLALAIAFYCMRLSARMGPRPEDRLDAEIAEGAGEFGFYSPHSWWPLAVGFAAAVAFAGIVFGWWLFLIGAGLGGMAVIGLVFEYYRGEPVH